MLNAMAVIYQSTSDVLQEGRRRGQFEDVRPLLVYFTLFAPLVVFVGARPVRQAMKRLNVTGDWDCDAVAFQRHLQRVIRRLLMPVPAHPISKTRRGRKS